MAHGARARGIPGELPVMGALVESGLANLKWGDADSAGFFGMRVGIWNQGEYSGYPENPAPPPDFAVLTSSAKSLRVSMTGRFTYSFVATPERSGKIKLISTKKIKVGSKTRKLKLADRSFTAAANGNVEVNYKLSVKNLRALKRMTSLTFNVSITDGIKNFAAKLKLKPPKKSY